MPTLGLAGVAGHNDPSARRCDLTAGTKHAGRMGNFSAGGFTLVEVLVVLAIIAITVGAARLSLGSAQRSRVALEATRLASLLGAAADDAVLRHTQLGLRLDGQDYRFLRLTADGWREPVSGLFRPRKLPPGVRMQLRVEGLNTASAAPMDRDTDGSADGPKPAPQPQILLLSSGEHTDFTVILEDLDSGERYSVESAPRGRFVALPHGSWPAATPMGAGRTRS